jgi:hypothetical protein
MQQNQTIPEIPYAMALQLIKLHVASRLLKEGKPLIEVHAAVFESPHLVEEELAKQGIKFTAAQ